MQFREVGRKVQCLASVYDPASKRTRQKMVYSLNSYGENAVPKAAALSTGSDEERAVWVGEIADYISNMKAKASEDSMKIAPLSLRYLVDKIINDHNSQSSLLTDEDLKAVRADVTRLLAALAPRKSRKAAGRKGVDDSVKERARELRKTETVARTVELLAEEGYAVSKSWVQKWAV